MAESTETGVPRKKRVESLDAFRGFTVFSMIFVIMAAGYRNLPLTFPQWGSAPVSTFKHADQDHRPAEWKFWAGDDEEKLNRYRLGTVENRNDDGTYDVVIPAVAKDAEPDRYAGVKIWHARPLKPKEQVIATTIGPDRPPRIQGKGNGCTFTDWVAPFFVFIVGLCIPLSRSRRGGDWWKHVGTRTLFLILLGVAYISLILKLSWWWGILQAIGVAYFMGAAAMKLPVWGRWVAVAVIGAFHGWMSFNVEWWLRFGESDLPFYTIATFYDSIKGAQLAEGQSGVFATIAAYYKSVVADMNVKASLAKPFIVHCTPWASISYGLITIVGTLLGEAVVTRDSKTILKQSLLLGVVFTVVGILLHIYQAPMNKEFVSPAYSAFTSGLAAFCFLAFYWVIDVWGIGKWAFVFNVFGANALLAYFLQPVVRIFFQNLGLWPFFTGQSGWSGIFWAFVWTMVLWSVTLWCNKKNIYWKL